MVLNLLKLAVPSVKHREEEQETKQVAPSLISSEHALHGRQLIEVCFLLLALRFFDVSGPVCGNDLLMLDPLPPPIGRPEINVHLFSRKCRRHTGQKEGGSSVNTPAVQAGDAHQMSLPPAC